MSAVKVGLFAAVVGLCVLQIHAYGALTKSTVIGWPTLNLPGSGNGVLTGLTILYDDPDFTKLNKTIDAYLGVPFAEPPIANLRFADPVPHEIQGDYNATFNRAICPQSSILPNLNPDPFFPIIHRNIDEDCLYLSIYTPSPKPSTSVPVLVWIHGGGYNIGAGSSIMYDPIPLVALTDIIVLNVNYRLGVFGFMTTGDDVASGNFAMMDQLLALQWVRDNIAAFGGDPQRVTIAGESAGGTSVGLHMLSPLSRGLYHQAIMQSGNAACTWGWTTMERAAEGHRAFAERCNCSRADSQAMLDCMQAVDADELMEQQSRAPIPGITSPVVDGHFLPDDPMEMIKRRQFHVLPTLIGSNQNESAINFAFSNPPDSLNERPTMEISTFKLLVGLSSSTREEGLALEQQYIDWSVADNATGDQMEGYLRLQTDQTFACATEYYSRALEAAGAEVYRYELTHHPAWSAWAGVPTWTAATHVEEIQYLFAWGLHPTYGFLVGQTDEEKDMSVEFMRYWSNFVISGNPNEPVESTTYPEWPRYTMPEQEYKILSLNMTNGRAMRAAECSLWMNFLPRLHIQAAPIEEIFEDWEKDYEMWRDTDMPNWTTKFNKYKEENTCPAPTP